MSESSAEATVPVAPGRVLKRRFMDSNATAPTFIGQGTLFVGDITGNGQFVILGTVRGDGDIAGNLLIAAGASWQGNVRAEHAIVAGSIDGSITVIGKIEIGNGAVIRGKVVARTVAIASGAVIDGDVEVTSGGSIRQFEEKRGPP